MKDNSLFYLEILNTQEKEILLLLLNNYLIFLQINDQQLKQSLIESIFRQINDRKMPIFDYFIPI